MRFEKATYENFAEGKYLLSNPDVFDAINRGEFKSGFDHFQLCGNLEDRYQKVSLQKDDPLAIVHIPKCAGTALRIEVQSICPSLYQGKKYSVTRDKKRLVRRRSNAKNSADKTSKWSLAELSQARTQHSCIMGHISFKDFWEAGFKDILIVVREPRIRLLSEWMFLTSNNEYANFLANLSVTKTQDYFTNYAKIYSKNVMHQLINYDLIFDYKTELLNLSCYWNDEIPRLMKETFGHQAKNIRALESSPQKREIDFRILNLIHELTERDSIALNRLKSARLLSSRSNEQLEDEFQQYLEKHFNYSRRLL